LQKARNLEGRLHETKYVNEVIAPSFKQALKTMAGYDIEKKRVGGKYVITESEKKTFDDAINAYLGSDDGEEYIRVYHNGDPASAEKSLKGYFPTSIKEDIRLESPYSPPSSGSSGDRGLSQRALSVTYSSLPTAALARKDAAGNTIEAKPSDKEFPTLTLFNVSSDQATFPRAQEFKTKGTLTMQGDKVIADDNKSNRVTAHPTDIMNVGGKLFIVGRKTSQPRTTAKKDGIGMSMDLGGEDDTQDFNQLEQVIIPYDGNEAIIQAAFPWMNDQSIKQSLGWTGQKQNNARVRKEVEQFQTDQQSGSIEDILKQYE
jgi:hypothetical protein